MGSPKEKLRECEVCAFASADSFECDVHNTTQRHIYNKTVKKYHTIRKSKLKDRHGVSVVTTCDGHVVTYTPSNGMVKLTVDWSVKELNIVFLVNNTSKPAELLFTSLLHPLYCFSLICTSNGKDTQIGDGKPRKVMLTFNSPGVGIYSVPVCFQLKKNGREFHIIRELFVEVKSQPEVVLEEEEKESPFTSEPWFAMRKCVPAKNDNGGNINKITDYLIPKSYEPLFKHNMRVWHDPPMTQEQLDLLQDLLAIIPFDYDEQQFRDVYCTFFHLMLHMDEYFTLKGLHHYNMSGVPLRIVASNRVELEVPGLAEKRPSVIKGDIISVRVHVGPDSWETIEYEGLVAEVRDSVIWIKGFNQRLIERLEQDGSQLRFDVRFLFNRYPTYLMHRAIDWAQEEHLDTIIFPQAKLLPPLIPDFNFPFFNELVYKNDEQRKAVINIVRGEARPAPYIVYGPPGTGKTHTIVEAILQVKKLFKKSFILVCAASNAACDNITSKLIPHCTTAELVRLNSSSRDIKTLPEDVRKYSNCSTVTIFNMNNIKKFRITVCTLITVGSKLAEKRNALHRVFHHYSHMFIDEAGQALEPGILVALSGVLGPARPHNIGGQLILAGDPLQLGPVCTSRLAEDFGLGVSFLERLMEYCHLYQLDEENNFNPLYITKLLQNFRSHPNLLKLPNELFYKDLKSSCSLAIMNDKIGTLYLLGKREEDMHNCIFHGVIGQERREGKSPSFYNQQELDAVVHDVNILMNLDSSAEVKQTDIGIICPYIRQVYKLKNCLGFRGWPDIEVGTTETFQGREKRIILISTVRSNRNLLNYDKKYKLGFLDNQKRFNVAITRAQSLLIIIGCPHTLEMDKDAWAKLIAYSKATQSYKGCQYNLHGEPWTKEVLKRLQQPILAEES